MAPYISHPEAEIRRRTLERLSMAVMGAEPWRANSPERSVGRLWWLLALVEDSHARFPDMIPAFLDELRYHGDDEPFDAPLRTWLHHWLKCVPSGVRVDHIRGTLILLGDCGSEWDEAAPKWLELLDDPSDYVRGCAAKMLGEHCGSDTRPSTGELFELIKAKEIARPGIAGSFWSGLQFEYEGPADVVDWMMEILEKRKDEEPEDMPFNGVDFHLHELCDGSLEAIDMMLKWGHKELALEAATETSGVVEGMKEVLLQFGNDLDPQIARDAWHHLARYYRTLHPRVDDPTLVCELAHWDDRARAFVMRQGAGETWRDVMVIYPEDASSTFDDALAWHLIDKALPPQIRGAVRKNSLLEIPDEVPYGFADKVTFEFEAGPIITVEGDPRKKTWSRIDIIARGLQYRWDPR